MAKTHFNGNLTFYFKHLVSDSGTWPVHAPDMALVRDASRRDIRQWHRVQARVLSASLNANNGQVASITDTWVQTSLCSESSVTLSPRINQRKANREIGGSTSRGISLLYLARRGRLFQQSGSLSKACRTLDVGKHRCAMAVVRPTRPFIKSSTRFRVSHMCLPDNRSHGHARS